MVSFDHAESYKGYGIRAFGHRNRLKTILKEIDQLKVSAGENFCDIGCSNGYITDQIRKRLHLHALGLDHNSEHLLIGRERYPEVHFEEVDLNKPNYDTRKFALVTCFETLEHVGNLETAVQNVLSRIALGGAGTHYCAN
jgi:2-polyprenyl-3-methyl-5-hydroxy-6-metoxy-1,4-benzoquinol methylase